MKWSIPFFQLDLGDEEKRAVLEVLDSNWLTTGPKIETFERRFAESLGSDKLQAIAVSNCTVALHLSLLALGIGPGDEVICPSLTFVATANAVRYTGAIPVFADICSPDDWTLDPEDISRKINGNTRAILPVHYAGYPCRMDALFKIAKQSQLKIVEDNAHGPMAQWEGKFLGTLGDFGCFSFFSNKNMTTGEGGLVVTRDPELAEKVRLMRSHGMTHGTYDRHRGRAFGYDVTALGFNYRMDEIRAALGIAQLDKLKAANGQRKDRVLRYRKTLSEKVPDVTFPFADREGDFGYHIFPVLLPERYDRREALMQALADRGIQTSIHYRPVHTFTAYNDFDCSLPITDSIAPRILTLPLYPGLRDDQIQQVCDALAACL